MPVTLLDIIVIAVMLISAVLAMVRGFTREVLAIASWGAAAVAAIYFLPQVQPFVADQLKAHLNIGSDTVAAAVSAGGIFLVALIVVSFVTMRISDVILDSRIGPLDRILGFVFGAARGLLLVVIAFLFFAWLVPREDAQPSWVREAKSKPLLESAGVALQNALVSVLPDDPESTILKKIKSFGKGAGDSEGDAPDEDARPAAEPKPTDSGSTGFRTDERQDMKRLVESSAQ